MGQVAFVFAGQGSQLVGMGRDLCGISKASCSIFEQAGDAVKSLCFEGPEEDLCLTLNTQPCVYTMDMACAMALWEAGITPKAVAGFSLGELAALSFAGAISFSKMLDLVNFRAEAMQDAGAQNPGAMLAVLKLDQDQVESICETLDRAYPANINAPGQIVVSCAVETVEALMENVRALGGKCIRLKVSGAFHSPFMEEAKRVLEKKLESMDFPTPSYPVYANVTAEPYGDVKALLARQVTEPVLWHETILNMARDGVDTFIEVGPAKC